MLAVHDLDAAGALWQRLGFRVGARNRHPWGTENRLVQFPGSFIELITVGDAAAIPAHAPGRFSFGAFVRDHLARHEGLTMLVLDSADAQADAARFARLGIGDFAPFPFARAARRPDGSETRVAFTLAFAMDPALPGAGFFTCQQHHPENFWNPEFQLHPNGATGLAEVVLGVPDPGAHAGFLAGFCDTPAQARDGGGLVFALAAGGRLAVVPRPGPGLLEGLAVTLPDPDRQAARLREAGIAFTGTSDGSLLVPDLSGTALTFAAPD